MGRDKRNERRGEHFTQLVRSMMEEPAWRALSSTAQALYPWIRLEWKGPKANNNGKISLSVRQAAAKMGIDMKTAARGFQDLQAKGFLVVTEIAHLGTGGAAKSNCFELTEIPLPHKEERQGRKLYRQWREGHDFPIAKAAINNPTGANGNSEPRPKNRNSTVVRMGTSR